ncbi:MAG: AbrB/MazE/SpoVT family DNA-binding domain-containing protein [Methanobacteriaceae archaeon]|jgi:AbrB family looped-hinge helix DNA binding protein|nr:AbrB/MazE/SpoVT family DNA-binding domain-containing protein [Candidatus Methanorudis spinitermitis]
MLSSKIYNNNQTVIPSVIRKKHNLKPGDIIEWIEEDNGEIKIKFREKSKLRDIIGIINTKNPTNAVKLKKMTKDEIKKFKKGKGA